MSSIYKTPLSNFIGGEGISYIIMTKYELAIIGGSFAGLSCAGAAAARGLKTVVFDKKKRPGSYTQSTGIFVKEIADQIDLPSHLTNKIHGVRLYSPNLEYVDLISPGYYFLATDTCRVLEWFSKEAENKGTKLVYNENINNIETRESDIYFPDQDISSKYLVAADGARSRTAKELNLGVNKSFLLGAEFEVSGIKGIESDFLHVFLDSKLAPGYIGWIVPGVSHFQIGIAVKYPKKPKVKELIEKVSGIFDTSGMKITGSRGGFIPCGGVVKPYYKDNVCLVGDAGGMVSPLTAGGIHPAIEIGRLLGIAVSDYIQDGGINPGLYIKKHLPSFTIKNQLRNIFDILSPPDFLYNFLIGNSLFKKSAQLIFFHHRGLLTKKAWEEILRKK